MGNMQQEKTILALVSDLLFTVKINDAAKRAGMSVDYTTNGADFLERIGNRPPSLVIMDLNISTAEPVKLIQQLKSDNDMKGIQVLSYVSHVQGELKQKAQEAGCDVVLARSAFTQNLQQILRRHSGSI